MPIKNWSTEQQNDCLAILCLLIPLIHASGMTQLPSLLFLDIALLLTSSIIHYRMSYHRLPLLLNLGLLPVSFTACLQLAEWPISTLTVLLINTWLLHHFYQLNPRYHEKWAKWYRLLLSLALGLAFSHFMALLYLQPALAYIRSTMQLSSLLLLDIGVLLGSLVIYRNTGSTRLPLIIGTALLPVSFATCFVLDERPVSFLIALLINTTHLYGFYQLDPNHNRGRALWYGRLLLLILGIALFHINKADSSVTDQRIMLLEGLFCSWAFLHYRKQVVPLRTLLFILIVWLSMCFSNLLADLCGELSAPFTRSLTLPFHLVFMLAAARAFHSDPRMIFMFVAAVIISTFSLQLVLIQHWISLHDPREYHWTYGFPLVNHIRHLNYVLCIAMIYAAWATLTWQGAGKRLAWLAFCIATGMTLWTGGRGGLLASFIGILCLLPAYSLRTHASTWLSLVLASLVALLTSTIFPAGQYPGWFSALIRSEMISANSVSSGRLEIWGSLIPSIREHPWLGLGDQATTVLLQQENFTAGQAHNGLMQLLPEWGIVGTTLYLLAFLPTAVRGLLRYAKLRDQAPLQLILGSALLVALGLFSIVDGIFYYAITLCSLMLAVAMLQCYLPEDSSVQHSRHS